MLNEHYKPDEQRFWKQFFAAELKCDYYHQFLSSQAFPGEKKEFKINNTCLLMCFVHLTLYN